MCRADAREGLTGVALVLRHREEQVLRRDEVVLERIGLLLGLGEDAAEPSRCGELHVALHLRLARELLLGRGEQLLGRTAERLDDARNDPALLLEQRREQIFDVELGTPVLLGGLLCRDQRFLGLLGHLLRIDHFSLPP